MQENGLVSEGEHPGVAAASARRETRKGVFGFLEVRITRGKDKGRMTEFLVPRSIDPQLLVGKACVVEVKHVAKHGRVYANVVAISAQPGSKVTK